MARSVQKQVRLTPEEAAEYVRLQAAGKTADLAMLLVLEKRFPFDRRVDAVGVDSAGAGKIHLGTPLGKGGAVSGSPASPVSRIRVPEKRFKPDFKGKT